MDLLPGANITAGALNAEKLRLQIIAQNIANANTTRTETGEPYRRKVVSFETELLKAAGSEPGQTLGKSALKGVRVAGIHEDPSEFKMVYNPSHPHADKNGMLALPNVETAVEMVDLITSSRGYEANLAVMKTARSMARQALSINL